MCIRDSDWIGSKAAFGVFVFAYLWKNFGYDMVLWLSGLSAINPALYEAAQLDGAGSLQRFVRITLPNLMQMCIRDSDVC